MTDLVLPACGAFTRGSPAGRVEVRIVEVGDADVTFSWNAEGAG